MPTLFGRAFGAHCRHEDLLRQREGELVRVGLRREPHAHKLRTPDDDLRDYVDDGHASQNGSQARRDIDGSGQDG